MIKNIKKLVILGGGSAGWMTASMLVKAFPDFDITVIESPEVPTVGVGESTLGGIRNFCHYIGIDEADFMPSTDASYKMSIKFTDFYDKDAGSFHYPFGKPYVVGTNNNLADWFLKKALEPKTPVTDFVNCYYPQAAMFDTNKYSLNKHGKFEGFNPELDVAYHFDASKFGEWLKTKYCIPRGITHIADTVVSITTNDNGIDQLILKSGVSITADLFVDCTGFKSLLLGNTLNEPFESYEDMLPNNRAWATRVQYKDKERELEPYTECTAIGHGWVWNIPSWERLGTGYVYSDKFITPEDAQEEFKQHLMSDKVDCPKTREEVDALEFKDIKMRVGIHNRTFVKNVVAIGLSAGFIEPLESNGLFSVHEFLFKLLKTLQNRTVTQFDRDVYNSSVRLIFNNFAEFVAMHYALSVRNDTEYWQANANRVYDPGLDQLTPSITVGFNAFAERKMFTGYTHYEEGITFISTGMNNFMIDKVDQEFVKIRGEKDQTEFWAPYFVNLEKNRERWKKAAESELTLYQHLKKYIYTNE